LAALKSVAAYLSAPAATAASIAALAADFSASGGFAQPMNTRTNARTIISDTAYLKCFITIFLLFE
jgi:hypothetical protein